MRVGSKGHTRNNRRDDNKIKQEITRLKTQNCNTLWCGLNMMLLY